MSAPKYGGGAVSPRAGGRPGLGGRPGYDSMGAAMSSAESRRRMMMARKNRKTAGI